MDDVTHYRMLFILLSLIPGAVSECGILKFDRDESEWHGHIKYGVTLSEGSIAEILCDIGYSLVGEKIIMCNRNGKWNITETPNCRANRCTNPMDLLPVNNGSIISIPDSRTGLYIYGSAYFVVCDQGYFTKDSIRQCLENGSWSGDTPKCEPDDILDKCEIVAMSIFGISVAVVEIAGLVFCIKWLCDRYTPLGDAIPIMEITQDPEVEGLKLIEKANKQDFPNEELNEINDEPPGLPQTHPPEKEPEVIKLMDQLDGNTGEAQMANKIQETNKGDTIFDRKEQQEYNILLSDGTDEQHNEITKINEIKDEINTDNSNLHNCITLLEQEKKELENKMYMLENEKEKIHDKVDDQGKTVVKLTNKIEEQFNEIIKLKRMVEDQDRKLVESRRQSYPQTQPRRASLQSHSRTVRKNSSSRSRSRSTHGSRSSTNGDMDYTSYGDRSRSHSARMRTAGTIVGALALGSLMADDCDDDGGKK